MKSSLLRIGMQVLCDSCKGFLRLYAQDQMGSCLVIMHNLTHANIHHQPKRAGQGGFKALGHADLIRSYLPFTKIDPDQAKPRRKSLEAPLDKRLFVKPVKQCFIKNPRLMPMTRIMLTLLSGWAGDGNAIETTIGIIAKHIGRSRRQVFRYLSDALEEGYMYYTRTKDRIGRYTGIRIKLNFAAIRFSAARREKNSSNPAEKLEVTYESETNDKYLLKKDFDPSLLEKLERFATLAGFDMPYLAPT